MLLIRERIRRLLEGAIFYGLLVVIALTAIPYGTVDPWWESIFESAVFLLAMFWIIEGSLARSIWVREHQLLLPLLAMVVFALIQSLTLGKSSDGPAMAGALMNRAVSADPFETWRFALKLLAVTLTLGLLLRYASSESRLRALIYVVVGIALASALFGLLSPTLPQNWLRLVSGRLIPDQSYGQFENRNHFAFLMEMAIGLVLGLAVNDWRQRKRLALYVLSGLIMWGALLLTHSRGGVVSLMLEIPFFFFLLMTTRNSSQTKGNQEGRLTFDRLSTKERSAKPPLPSHPWITTVVGGVLLLAAAGASVIFIGGDETIRRLERTPGEFASQTNSPPKMARPQIWKATWELIKENPVVGVGFAGYSVAISQYLKSSGEWTPEQAHNDYLELLASGGLVGAGLGLWFLIVFFRMARERLRGPASFSRAARSGALAGLLAVAAHSLFDYGLHITINCLVCSLLIVLAVKGCGNIRLQQPA